MISIGRFAKLAKTSARTIRFYESIGLIKSSRRGENNYRYYEAHLIEEVNRIKELQALGFSLDEIKSILKMAPGELVERIKIKLTEVNSNIDFMQQRKLNLQNILSVSEKIDLSQSINEIEREQYMEAIQSEILNKLQSKKRDFNKSHLDYLERDRSFHTAEQVEFIQALQQCLDFATKHDLTLGPSRGSSSASMVLYALGISNYDPSDFGLIPERLLTQAPNIHWDVEFERGQIFIDYCAELNRKLKYGQIQAFKMPLLDIIKNVELELGFKPAYHEVDENSDQFLKPFRTGQIEKIFLFDVSEDALFMRFEDFLPGYAGLTKIKEYLTSQPILNFRDVINIFALWNPSSEQKLVRLEQYRSAKRTRFEHSCLSVELRKWLESNYGMIIYHEDILQIISYYTQWDYQKCNKLRQKIFFSKSYQSEEFENLLKEFQEIVPKEIQNLVLQEAPHTFCLPHSLAFSYFTKITTILQTQYRFVYLNEISKWEEKNGYRWDDIGIHIRGISLLQN